MERAPGLRAFLRAGTQEIHEALDASVRARGFFLSLARYREFLARSLAFQEPAERVLERGGIQALLPDWPARRRAHLLRADLQALDAAPDAGGFANAPPRFADANGRERLLGLAYVVEGSTLGAASLLHSVAPLGVTAERGASFLANRGLPARSWHTFLDVLESEDRDGFDRELALRSARAAFSAASDCFA